MLEELRVLGVVHVRLGRQSLLPQLRHLLLQGPPRVVCKMIHVNGWYVVVTDRSELASTTAHRVWTTVVDESWSGTMKCDLYH